MEAFKRMLRFHILNTTIDARTRHFMRLYLAFICACGLAGLMTYLLFEYVLR